MPETQFNKQAYLLSYFDELISNGITNLPNFHQSHVYLLPTFPDKSFSQTMSILQNRMGVENFTKLKTYQYNGITPKVRLYRIDYNDQKEIIAQKEFIFQKDAKYTVESMLKPIKKDNCGIKSINWKLAGTNPVTAEKQIEVELQLYFDSITAFSGGSFDDMSSAWAATNNKVEPFKDVSFSFCEFDETTKNYWSLLFHPQVEKDKYDTYKFRIKAEVGWEDIGENIKSQLKLSDVEESIKKLNYTFFLNLVKHQFNFNEDGSLVVVANYIASFESTMANKQFDILGGLQEEIDKLKKSTINDILQKGFDIEIELFPPQIGSFKNPAALNRPPNSSFTKILQEFAALDETNAARAATAITNLTIDQFNSLSTLSNTLADDEKLKKLKSCINELPDSIQVLINSNLNSTIDKTARITQVLNRAIQEEVSISTALIIHKYYSNLINDLIETNQYYHIWVPETTMRTWLSWYTTGLAKPPSPTIYSASDDESFVSGLEVTRIKRELKDSSRTETLTKLTDESQQVKSKEFTENEIFKNNTTGENGVSIVYTTFGAFINSAFNIVKKYLTEIGTTESNSLLSELYKFNIILSNISDENQILKSTTPTLNSTNNIIKNLALIPIDLNLIRTFLIENIVKPKKTTYPLFFFLKDAMSSLLLASVNSFGEQNNEVDKYANLSLGSTLVTLANYGPNEPMRYFFYNEQNNCIINPYLLGEVGNFKTNKIKDFYPIYGDSTFKNLQKYFYTYFVIYDKNLTDFRPKNNAIEDEKQGVYHYTYAQDYGLVKSINFSKIDQPYLKEAKAVGKKTFYLGQFRDRYNADITMIGNNIYYPGMILYISPSVEATIKTNNNASFSQISGIGGYYFVNQVESAITEDGYETKLKTIWQTDGYDLPNSILEQDACKAFLNDLGFGSNDPKDPLSTAMNNLAETSRMQILEDKIKVTREEIAKLAYFTQTDGLGNVRNPQAVPLLAAEKDKLAKYQAELAYLKGEGPSGWDQPSIRNAPTTP